MMVVVVVVALCYGLVGCAASSWFTVVGRPEIGRVVFLRSGCRAR